MVKLEEILDLDVVCLVCDICKWIEEELDYFGYIKVIVIWEICVIDYVK